MLNLWKPEMDSLPYALGVQTAEAGKVFTAKDRLIVYPVVDTTIRIVDELILQNKPDGMTVLALQQTAGRGSNGRQWASPKGNVLVSRVVEINEGNEYGQEMEMMAACAIFEILQEYLPGKVIVFKYPNDLLVDGLKIGGCLVSPIHDLTTVLGSSRKVNMSIGFNLNIAPELPGSRPTTCFAAHGGTLSIAAFMQKFDVRFSEIQGQYRREKDFNAILARMGFLDSCGRMTLQGNVSGKKICGTYAGFCARIFGNKPIAFMLLKNRDRVRPCAVHGRHMTNAPKRTHSHPASMASTSIAPHA